MSQHRPLELAEGLLHAFDDALAEDLVANRGNMAEGQSGLGRQARFLPARHGSAGLTVRQIRDDGPEAQGRHRPHILGLERAGNGEEWRNPRDFLHVRPSRRRQMTGNMRSHEKIAMVAWPLTE